MFLLEVRQQHPRSQGVQGAGGAGEASCAQRCLWIPEPSLFEAGFWKCTCSSRAAGPCRLGFHHFWFWYFGTWCGPYLLPSWLLQGLCLWDSCDLNSSLVPTRLGLT